MLDSSFNASINASIMTVPISVQAHQRAQSLCRRQGDRQLAQQIYLNVLAVAAVDFYLQCMGIETNLTTSQSVDPVLLTVLNTADLDLGAFGKLECRPVLPAQSSVHIPPEVWTDRLGYVAVQLDETLRSATLLGFIDQVDTQEVPLHRFRPIDDLMDTIDRLRSTPVGARTRLSQWLENGVTEGWRSLEALINPQQNHLALGFRTHTQVNDRAVKRAKLLDLGLQLDEQSLALLVAVMPSSQGTRSSDVQEMLDILIQLHPSHGATYLPPDVHISLTSMTGEVLQTVRSRQYDNYIQLKRFRGMSGECFDVQVSLGHTTIAEKFVI